MTESEKFTFKTVAQMTGREMFCVARLRIDTFVTEQEITVPELDDEDLDAIQVYLLNDQKQTLWLFAAFFKKKTSGC